MGAILSLSHFSIYQFFYLFPFFGPTKQYVQSWKKVDMWNRCCKFTPLDPTKQYVHCMRKVTTWCHFENLPPLEPSKPYGWFNIWRKLTCWVIAIDLSSGPLQNIFVRHMNPTWHPESCLKCLFLPLQESKTLNEQNWNFESCLEFTPTGPYTAIHSTYGSSWHVDSFF